MDKVLGSKIVKRKVHRVSYHDDDDDDDEYNDSNLYFNHYAVYDNDGFIAYDRKDMLDSVLMNSMTLCLI